MAKATLGIAGLALIVLAFTANWIGIGNPGFGPKKQGAVLLGLLLFFFAIGLLRSSQVKTWIYKVASLFPSLWGKIITWLRSHAFVLGVAVVWAFIMIPGLIGVELYARSIRGFLLWNWSLEQRNFFELDRLKVYNRGFYQQRARYFKEWPIKLELFDSDKPAPRYLFKPNLRMTLRGNTIVPATPGEASHWSSNSWGFRGPEFSVAKSPEVIRIVCLGASTTEGSHGDQETYPYFLQQELSRHFPGSAVEVINAGFHGQGVDDLLEMLRQKVFPLTPDVVIFYEAANQSNPQEFLKGFGFYKFRENTRYKRWDFLYKHSALFRIITDRVADTQPPPPMHHAFDDSLPKTGVTHYKTILGTMVRESKTRNITFVLASFITLAHEGLVVQYRDNPGLFDDLYNKWYPFTPGEIACIYNTYNFALRDVARTQGAFFCDLAAKFTKDIKLFPFDHVHFSPEGNKLLATLLGDFLAREVLPEIIDKNLEVTRVMSHH
jgi:lysophospholipase L1-like esterase